MNADRLALLQDKRAQHKRASTALAVLAIVVVSLAMAGCNKLKARDLLNRGVMAYRDGQYDTSIEDFKEAKDADPGLLNARLYLATAYAQRYVPGAPSDENMRAGEQAIAEFKEVLTVDPNNLTAVDGLSSLLYQMGTAPFDQAKLDEAKTYYLKHIQLKPEDPEPYYRVAVQDWAVAYRANGQMRSAYNAQNPTRQIQPAMPLPDKLRAMFAMQYSMDIDEGLQNVERAISLRPDYTDAMAYQQLLLRQKADESDSATRATLEKQADDISRKANEIKQNQAATPAKS